MDKTQHLQVKSSVEKLMYNVLRIAHAAVLLAYQSRSFERGSLFARLTRDLVLKGRIDISSGPFLPIGS